MPCGCGCAGWQWTHASMAMHGLSWYACGGMHVHGRLPLHRGTSAVGCHGLVCDRVQDACTARHGTHMPHAIAAVQLRTRRLARLARRGGASMVCVSEQAPDGHYDERAVLDMQKPPCHHPIQGLCEACSCASATPLFLCSAIASARPHCLGLPSGQCQCHTAARQPSR